MAMVALLVGLCNGKWAPFFFVRKNAKKYQVMFTNTPILAHEAEILNSVQEFTKTVDPKDCMEVLDTLFFDWISSESSDDTTSQYRSQVAGCYQQLKSLLAKVGTRQEVTHD